VNAASLAHLADVPRSRALADYRTAERAKGAEHGPARAPTIALRLAASVFGLYAKEGHLPARVFAEEDIQVYSGVPYNDSAAVFRATGETVARKIVAALFPHRGELGSPPCERYRPVDGLPDSLRAWLKPIPGMIEGIRTRRWSPPALNLLNFEQGGDIPWFLKAETLCGQVPDGTRRVLAYVLMAAETPEELVHVRILSIRPAALGLLNGATLALRFILDPRGTREFARKRFAGAAFLVPTDRG
jgi:hypothetical protein